MLPVPVPHVTRLSTVRQAAEIMLTVDGSAGPFIVVILSPSSQSTHFFVMCAVMVMEGERHVGIFTSKDLIHRVVARGLQPDIVTIETVMTPNPDVVTLDTPILDAVSFYAA